MTEEQKYHQELEKIAKKVTDEAKRIQKQNIAEMKKMGIYVVSSIEGK